ncbi:MAG TPA: septal ring lytic transglycosylase RlpA family protein [Anaeromyxobacteraceae bacterium]|nr:septal ring lytic transglycosylase RlpA family protein [Anaeromyxobacteraceae bacterium]
MKAPFRARAVAAALAACIPAAAGAAGRAETGLASYYRDELHGRPTASGQLYDRSRLTCAHRSHPFGAMLEVVNLENGRKVQVMVNDRGPYGRGRVVDLSREAARRLGMLKRGTARVRVARVT